VATILGNRFCGVEIENVKQKNIPNAFAAVTVEIRKIINACFNFI
jgi:hypothetical protein